MTGITITEALMTDYKNQQLRVYENLKCNHYKLFLIGNVFKLFFFKSLWPILIFIITVIFTLKFFAVPLSAQNNSNGLKVHPDNPHFFIYNGWSTYFITYGNDGLLASSAGYYDTMKQYKLNHKRSISLMILTDHPPTPYNGNDINAGWNHDAWQLVKDNVRWANERDIIVGITFFSTPQIEKGETRWNLNVWNERNGGPIPDDGDGKDEFYTLDSYGSEISESYSSSWSWQRKNQYRQEELVKKYLDDLKDFPNVYYVPMYEIGDHWGSSLSKAHRWHQHIAGLIKKYQPDRLVATVLGTLDEQEVAGWSEVDFLIFEGPFLTDPSNNKDLHNAYWSFNKPLVWLFSHPGTGRFPGGDEFPLEKMRTAVINGLHPATKSRDGGAQNGYALALANFISTVESWCDEPGQEITKDTVPPISGGSGVDLPRGGCTDNVGGGDPDSSPPQPPQGVKVLTEDSN